MCIRDSVNTGDNYNGDMMTNNNEEIITEVSSDYNNEVTSSSGKIIENGVFKGDTIKINSDDENIEIVSESERVEISVYKLERECEESYFVDMGQRVNFPQVYCCLLYTSRCV